MKEQYQIRRHYRNGMKNLVYDGFSSFFKTEQEAREATKADIKKIGKPVVVGGIGITNEHRRELDIVRYEIRKREVTPWETVGEIEVDPK